MEASSPARERSARVLDVLCTRGGGLALLVLAAGWWLAPVEYVDGDNAEFSTVGQLGGVAHPPGYPLYVLYLRALSWLPAESAAQAAARATVILGALAVLVLHRACRAWGASTWASTGAVAVLAGSPIFLRSITAAEVFTLNVLVAAVVLLLAASDGPVRGTRRTWLLALVAGLGLANHHTCVLLAPVGLLGALRGVRESEQRAPIVAGGAVVALALGLAVYVYPLVAPETAASWGSVDSLGELLALFTRQDYGGVGAFSPVPGEVRPLVNLAAFATSLGRAWLWGLALAAPVILIVRSVRPGQGEPRAGWIALFGSFVLAGPLLVARFNIDPSGIGLLICERFYALPIVLLVIPAAVACDVLAGGVARRLRHAWTRSQGLQALLGALAFAATAGLSLPHLLATHSPAVQRGVENMLRSLPPQAIVVTTGDDVSFGSRYTQLLSGIRRDVTIVVWPMTTLPWYRSRLAAQGLTIEPYAPGPDKPSIKVARQLLATGRPLFVEFSMGAVLEQFPTYPLGLLFRVMSPGSPMPTLDEVFAENRAIVAAFDLSYPRPSANAHYAHAMHVRYVRTWDILARALRDAGRIDEAREALDIRNQLDFQPAFGPRTSTR